MWSIFNRQFSIVDLNYSNIRHHSPSFTINCTIPYINHCQPYIEHHSPSQTIYEPLVSITHRPWLMQPRPVPTLAFSTPWMMPTMSGPEFDHGSGHEWSIVWRSPSPTYRTQDPFLGGNRNGMNFVCCWLFGPRVRSSSGKLCRFSNSFQQINHWFVPPICVSWWIFPCQVSSNPEGSGRSVMFSLHHEPTLSDPIGSSIAVECKWSKPKLFGVFQS